MPMPQIILLLVLLLSACNLPQPPAATPTLDSAAVATIAAATLSAIHAQTPAATPTRLPAAMTPSPEIPASATPSPTASLTPNPPTAPLGLRYTFACAYGGGAALTLTWQDAASNEDGYRIYRDENLLGQLAANTSEYGDNLPGYSGVFVYRVEAFNPGGAASARVTVNLTCQ